MRQLNPGVELHGSDLDHPHAILKLVTGLLDVRGEF